MMSMKNWGIVLGILVILTLLCSPTLAISKSDLISQYKTGQFPVPATPITIPTKTPQIPSWSTPSPSAIPWNDAIARLVERLKDEQKSTASYDTISFKDSTTKSGKPNIYLYSDRDLSARVQLAPEKAIIVSEPEYQPGKGWRAEIRNGSLNGEGDFLFYEAVVADSGWQKKEGFIIRAMDREQDMTFMLGKYGFNEKETVEFIDYWANHLLDTVDYAFYPQETGAVDRVMPLSVTPEPDQVSRIWFYAKPLVSAPEEVTTPEIIVRDGFYVVEWGVVIRDEYRI